MFSKRNVTYLVSLLVYANIVNLIFLGMRLGGIAMIRPIVFYEYMLIPLLVAFRTPVIVTYLYFIVVLVIDLIDQASFIFLFDVPAFVKNIEFYSLYKFSAMHYLLLIAFVAFLSVMFLGLKRLKLREKNMQSLVVAATAIIFVIFYSVDSLGGRTLLNEKNNILTFRYNLGAAISKDVYAIVKDQIQKPGRVTATGESATFQTFRNDSTGNQLLIIIESWGLPANKKAWAKITLALGKYADSCGWRAKFGSTKFVGSTVNSELRQLLNSTGDYRYLLNPDSAGEVYSIFNLKKQQGYATSAIHSFSGKMFQRNIWWRNIGIESVFFLDDVVHKEKLTSDQLNYSTPFASLNDEDAFRFISSVNDQKKKFAYFLTVNTHLPNRAKISDKNKFIDLSDLAASDDVQNQLNRVVELLRFFAREGGERNWARIFIVGDHMPPFSNETDRNFYSKKEVPHLTLSR